jgi:hypothetical protein
VRTQLARIAAQAGNFDRLYLLQEVELKIAEQRGELMNAAAARETLAEYALGVSPVFAFNLGSTYAVTRPPQPTKAQQLLTRFVQSSCLAREAANDCDRCATAHDLLDRLASTRP